MSLIINNLQLDLGMKIISELSKIDRFDATWSSIEKREGSTLMQLKSIATVKSVGASTRIEGSKMTDDEVSVLIENINMSSFEERDQQEVVGYFETLDTIAENYTSIGITEKTDALCLIVSEETGEISYVKDGNFELYADENELLDKLEKDIQ